MKAMCPYWLEERGLYSMNLRKLVLHNLKDIYREVEGHDMSEEFQHSLRYGLRKFQSALDNYEEVKQHTMTKIGGRDR